MSTDSLWHFSLDFYGRPGVAPACVALQDIFGADVNILLFVLWCARRGHMLTADELVTLDAEIATWRRGVVRTIREARRAVKRGAGIGEPDELAALRRQLQEAELAAEHIQQDAMAKRAPPPGDADPVHAARANLVVFADHACIPSEDARLTTLRAAFE